MTICQIHFWRNGNKTTEANFMPLLLNSTQRVVTDAGVNSVSVKEIFQRVADARCLRLGSQSEKLSESLTP